MARAKHAGRNRPFEDIAQDFWQQASDASTKEVKASKSS